MPLLLLLLQWAYRLLLVSGRLLTGQTIDFFTDTLRWSTMCTVRVLSRTPGRANLDAQRTLVRGATNKMKKALKKTQTLRARWL